LQHELVEIAFGRERALENRHRVRFRLGDVVHHKVFGYRGVVIGWDPKPTVDVSRWDGLERIDDPARHPFYHVVPDRNDSIEAFGAERPVRYVCQENLEECPADQRRIDADLEPQDWTWDPATTRYAPSDALRYKYAEDAANEDDGATERGMAKVQEAVNRWQYESRTASSESVNSAPLSMPKLLRLLQIVDTTPDAIAVQEAIKESRKAHPRLDLRRRLEDGVGELMMGNGDEAVAVYASIAEQDPDSYPEVHNKIATCQFMMGRIEEALEATLKTLELDPFHVQALNGLGLIHFDRGEYTQAIEAFRKSISIDPWSPVTAKLSVSIDLVNQTTQDDGEEVSR
jgi:hemimethylated DNA binding protein